MSDIVVLNVLYIRHGESYGNISSDNTAINTFEPDNPPLSDYGKNQAELLGDRMSKGKLDAIYSSPLERAIQTAYEIAVRQNNMPVTLLPDLMEVGTAPDYAGCSEEVLLTRYPLAVPCLCAPSPAGGMLTLGEETPAQMVARGKRIIDFLKRTYTHGETVAIVSHGTFYTYFICAALNIPVNEMLRFSSFNTGVSKFKFYDDGSAKLSFSNDTSHLYPIRNALTYTI